MLSVGAISEGFVLDHIQAGKSMRIYHHLGLDRLDCPVAIIKNARSNKSGVKDILKVECDIDTLGADTRGAKRIVFSNDGLIYYTDDHYASFELLYGDAEHD